jgi:NADPH:quinone reductase-like Zn-dependent oxidoreductase
VRAASFNRIDAVIAAGMLQGMMDYDFPVVLGRDFAGIVDAVGEGVSTVAVGDEVFGFVPVAPPLDQGAVAEYVVLPAESLVAKPDGVDFAAAAALPLAGAMAHALLEDTDPQPESTVLIVGAGGGVGSFAIQLAADRGATVLASGTDDDVARLTGLGASKVVGRAPGLAEGVRGDVPGGVDVLVDLVSYDAAGVSALAGLVRDGGRVTSPLGAVDPDADALTSRGIVGTNVNAAPTPELLATLVERVASRTLDVDIEKTISLDDAPKALSVFATGGVRGKIVVELGE